MKKEKPFIPAELLNPSAEFARSTEQIGFYWWYWDHVEKRMSMSPALLQILGYTPEEFDPSVPTIYKNIHPDDMETNLERVRRLLYGEDELYEMEFRIKNSKGEWQWYYNRGVTLEKDEKGNASLIGGISMDISGKFKQLMYRIEEQERLYQTLFNAAEDPIGLFTLTQDIIVINKAFHQTFGYSHEEFMKIKWMDLLHPEDIPMVMAKGPQLMQDGNTSVDYRSRHRDGRWLYLSSKSVLIPGEKSGDHLIMTIIRDETKRKMAMQELEEARNRAEESDRLKSAFLANMSHEIRTPMNSIVGFSNLLVNPSLTEEARELYVSRIVRNSELLLTLISDIIDLAKIESGQLPIVYGRQKLQTMISELEEYARDEIRRLGKTGVEVQSILECDSEIETDLVRLTQIMKNLVNNAIKFTDSGRVEVGCRKGKSKQRVEMYVKDSGIGIDPSNFEVIFNQFRQIDGSNTRKFGGTGLGLAICKNLAEIMGGDIRVSSAVGKGAEFIVELPLKLPHGSGQAFEKAEETEEEVASLRICRILVVEDEPDSLVLFREILSQMGHEVITASNGYEALQLLDEKELPDLVFMDHQMLVLSGTDTMKIMKQRFPSIKVVAQSAHALAGDRTKFLEEGFDAYLPKPFINEQLDEILKTLPA